MPLRSRERGQRRSTFYFQKAQRPATQLKWLLPAYPLLILTLFSWLCYFTCITGGELYNHFFPGILSPRTAQYQPCLWHTQFYMFIHWGHFQWLPCSPTHLLSFSESLPKQSSPYTTNENFSNRFRFPYYGTRFQSQI